MHLCLSALFWHLTCLVALYHISLCSASSCLFPHTSDESKVVAETHLKRLDDIKDKTFTTTSDIDGKKLTLSYQLCSSPTLASGTSCKELRNVSVVEESDGNCIVIGNYNDTNVSGGADWVSISYQGSQFVENATILTRDSVVTFLCDPNYREETFTMAQVSHCMGARLHYTFIITSPKVCAKSGLSGGSVFCILFFTFFGVYLLFGFLYKRMIVRAKGLEQIPNYDSWKEFGGLIADGCDFICRCNNRQSNKMYQGIDDSFSHPSDNNAEGRGDDHLLPM